MSNLEILVAVLITALTVFAGFAVHIARFNLLEGNRLTSMEARLMAIEAELKRICQVIGRHDAILREHDVEMEILKQK